MKYLIILCFLLIGCSVTPKEECPNQKEFFYDDKVQIIEGFYTGRTGIVSDYFKIVHNRDGAYCLNTGYRVLFVTTPECLAHRNSCPNAMFQQNQLERVE